MTSNTRTYGKRSRKQSSQNIRDSQQASPSPSSSTNKRRKVSPDTATRMPSPALTDEAEPLKNTLRHDDEDEGSLSQQQNSFASPVKPKKPARDLSGIFGAITSAQPASPSPTKLARRMLARSKTETSITSEQTADSGIDRTFSLPSLPSSPSRPVLAPSKSSSALLPVLPPAAESPKTRTYAGKYRSFLVNVSSQQSQTFDDENEYETRESYNSLRERWGVDNSEDDPYPQVSPVGSFTATPDASPSRKGKGKAASQPRPPPVPYPGGLSNPLKSISELRNKGESRRFLDELGYLFEGLDRNGGIGLKRASALEICTKLCDTEFARKAKAADLYARTWDLLVETGGGQGEDKILDIIVVFFAALVARDPTSLAELASRPPSESSSSNKHLNGSSSPSTFVDVLLSILPSMTPDIDPLVVVASRPGVGDAELKKVGLAKRDRAILTSVYQTITKAALFQHDTPISISLLTSHTLSILPPSLIPATATHVSTFLKSLRYSLAPNAAGAGTGTSFSSLAASLALRWTDAAQSVPLQSVYHHLRLLDAYLLNQWQVPPGEGESSQGTDDVGYSASANGGGGGGGAGENWREANDAAMKTARDAWLAQDLVAFGVCTELVDDEDEADASLSKKCLDMALRVLVSLTHGNKRWGRKITEGEYTMGLLLRTIYASAQGLETSRHEGAIKQEQSPAKVKAESDDEDAERAGSYIAPTSDDDPTLSSTKAGQGGSQYMDTLCLALGLLTNLVQIADSAKRVVRETSLDPACKLKKRACARKCVCPQRTGALRILTDIYTQFNTKVEVASTASRDALSTDSLEAQAEADASFLRGHLAVLFGLLMTDCPENQAEILSSLPAPAAGNGAVEDRLKLSRLLDQAKDFAAFYSAVSNTIGGEKESKITMEVVQFLEAQRDAA